MSCLRLHGLQEPELYLISDSALLASVCLITRSNFLSPCLFLCVLIMEGRTRNVFLVCVVVNEPVCSLHRGTVASDLGTSLLHLEQSPCHLVTNVFFFSVNILPTDTSCGLVSVVSVEILENCLYHVIERKCKQLPRGNILLKFFFYVYKFPVGQNPILSL